MARSNRAGYVSLSDMPDAKKEYVLEFNNLTGGMNTFDLDFELKPNESPLIQNLSWHNGVLCSRKGQAKIGDLLYGSEATPVLSAAPFLFHGWLIVQVKTLTENYFLFTAQKIKSEGRDTEREVGTQLAFGQGSVLDLPGTFVRYREDVLFKAKGVYRKIVWHEETDTITAAPVDAYIPVIQMNTVPTSGSGDQYQPMNRLTPTRKVMFNGDGETTVYHLPERAGTITSTAARASVEGTAGIPIVSFDSDAKTVTLESAPPQGQNNVTIQYTNEDNETDDAYANIMDSTAIAVFGGAQDLCVVVGGPAAQPNAYFWSGANGMVMDPGYFPYSQYNLAGDNEDPITAFGKQQNMLVIFQPRAVGRATYSTAEINGRVQGTMNYTRINAEMGCDLPRTLQLIDNNLVWCSRRDGVCFLRDSSAAYENNIIRISDKVNGDYRHPGLLDLMEEADENLVWSADTGERYVLGYNGDAYEWNYNLSTEKAPSWFYHTGIQGIAFTTELRELWEVTRLGVIAHFQHVFADFNEGIDKVYVLPPRNFGSYDRLKNIMSMIFVTRGDNHTRTKIEYFCDYASREDPTPLESPRSYQLSPRDLRFRDLARHEFAFVARRKPGYHNIRHLRVRLSNNTAGDDLSLVSAQIFYTFRGRQR